MKLNIGLEFTTEEILSFLEKDGYSKFEEEEINITIIGEKNLTEDVYNLDVEKRIKEKLKDILLK